MTKLSTENGKAKPLLFIQQPNFSPVKVNSQTIFRVELVPDINLEEAEVDTLISQETAVEEIPIEVNNEPEVHGEAAEIEEQPQEEAIIPSEVQIETKESEVPFEEADKMDEDLLIEDTISLEKDEGQPSVKDTIRRLAVYPKVLERPKCEAIINGKKVICQILSKRRDEVRIKTRGKIEKVDINDIQRIRVIR